MPPASVPVPSVPPPSLKVTVPVGAPPPPVVVTVAVKVTAWPAVLGFSEDAMLVVVVLTATT